MDCMGERSMSFKSDEQFRIKMRPYFIKIYEKIWPNCKVQDLRKEGFKVHPLDKEWGIDSIIWLSNGTPLFLQEKTRRYNAWGDFTQEYENHPTQQDGEWFHLGAHIYSYGFANELENNIEKYFIMDIVKFKLKIERNKQKQKDIRRTGFEHIGKLQTNYEHGQANFFGIPIIKLKSTIIRQKNCL